jgi:NADPH-dependent 2,4-dienoyl-CoA reductase/sulfur reductase-like enzyme
MRQRGVDVLIVGAGPAGLSAALAASGDGRRVLLLDASPRAGGQIWRHRDPLALPKGARQLLGRVEDAGVVLARRARVLDAASPRELVVDFDGRVDRVQTGALILATGASERFVPFPGWTLPGVVGVGGLQALIKGGLDLRASRVVLAGTGPLLFPVAAAVVQHGGVLAMVAEQANRGSLAAFALQLRRKPSALADAVRYRLAFAATPLALSTWVVRAEGNDRLERVVLLTQGREVSFRCEWLGTGMGLVPSTDLAQLVGCATDGNGVRVDAQQRTSIGGVWAAGECTGISGDAGAMAEGAVAGRGAVGLALTAVQRRRRDASRRFGELLARSFAVREEVLAAAAPDTILCRCEDVRVGDVDPRWTQRQAKLWTRVGMGSCQGAVCGPACQALFGWAGNAARPPLHAPRCREWAHGLESGRP